MGIETITILLFASLFVLIFIGVPLAFALGAVTIFFSIFLWGPESLFLLPTRTCEVMFNYILIALPLFIFMGGILEKSGIADDMYHAMHIWMGPLRGGLVVGTVMICVAFAAMSGVSAAAVITMGTLALPAMLKRQYNKHIAMGAIMAGGALGQLIPPSLLLILYGAMSSLSVGKLFLGGVLPGLLLAGLFIIYTLVRSALNKNFCPAMPKKERENISTREKIISIRGIILPVLLIIAVLGSIFTGIATPTEAAGIGATGSILCGLIYRKLSINLIKSVCIQTMKATCMVAWIMIGSLMFVSLYFTVGGDNFVNGLLVGSGMNRWVVMIIIQFVLIVLGCMMDPGGVVMLCTPIFIPIITALGFDPLWFGVLFIINLEMAYLTPPFGYNLFYMKAIVPAQTASMIDIYKAVIPFLLIDVIGLALCMVFPEIITWLPNSVIGN